MESFRSQKVTEYSTALIQTKPNTVDSMVFEKITTLEGAKAFITCFFTMLLDANLRGRSLETAYQNHLSSSQVQI